MRHFVHAQFLNFMFLIISWYVVFMNKEFHENFIKYSLYKFNAIHEISWTLNETLFWNCSCIFLNNMFLISSRFTIFMNTKFMKFHEIFFVQVQCYSWNSLNIKWGTVLECSCTFLNIMFLISSRSTLFMNKKFLKILWNILLNY